MVKLEGSEKQITWAENIRANMIATLKQRIEDNDAYYYNFKAINDIETKAVEKYPDNMERRERAIQRWTRMMTDVEKAEIILKVISGKENAVWFIDHRNDKMSEVQNVTL